MRKIEFEIEDEMHAEPQRVSFDSFSDAFDQLVDWAIISYGTPPNICPCSSWETCHRSYSIMEYDKSSVPWHEVKRTEILQVSMDGVVWLASKKNLRNNK